MHGIDGERGAGAGAGDVMVRRVLSAVLISAALSAYASCSAAVAQTSAGPAPNAASIIANNLGRHPKMDFTGTVPTQLIFQANKRVDQVEMSDLLRQIRRSVPAGEEVLSVKTPAGAAVTHRCR